MTVEGDFFKTFGRRLHFKLEILLTSGQIVRKKENPKLLNVPLYLATAIANPLLVPVNIAYL